jgi:hypothetical protein
MKKLFILLSLVYVSLASFGQDTIVTLTQTDFSNGSYTLNMHPGTLTLTSSHPFDIYDEVWNQVGTNPYYTTFSTIGTNIFHVQDGITAQYCTITVNVTNTTSIIATSFIDFLIFPNPTTDFININANAKLIGSTYTISDQLGKIVKTGNIYSDKSIIEIGNLLKGIYVFCVGVNMKQTFIVK